MSPDDPPDDDRPKKRPPRASWETPDPDDAAPVKSPDTKSKPTPAWTPPPLDGPPPRKKPARAQNKPPRASWEAPDPDEETSSGVVVTPAGTSVSGSWTEPVSGAAVTPPTASGRYAADVQAGSKSGSYTQSGS